MSLVYSLSTHRLQGGLFIDLSLFSASTLVPSFFPSLFSPSCGLIFLELCSYYLLWIFEVWITLSRILNFLKIWRVSLLYQSVLCAVSCCVDNNPITSDLSAEDGFSPTTWSGHELPHLTSKHPSLQSDLYIFICPVWKSILGNEIQLEFVLDDAIHGPVDVYEWVRHFSGLKSSCWALTDCTAWHYSWND